MVNNVGKTSKTLSTDLGTMTSFDSIDSISLITGEIDVGLLLFDPNGTLGVISNYTSSDNFIVTTYATSIDISTVLGESY